MTRIEEESARRETADRQGVTIILAAGCWLGFLNPGPCVFERHGPVEEEGLG